MTEARIVIVADDDDDGRERLAALLRRNGFRVCLAEHGRAVLDLLEVIGDERCVLVLDLEMPVLSGFDVLHVLDRDERLASLPVLICSGARLDLRPTGVREVFHKPVEIEELLPRVAEACSEPPSGVRLTGARKAEGDPGGGSFSDGLFDAMCALLELDDPRTHDVESYEIRVQRLKRVRAVLNLWADGAITTKEAERQLLAMVVEARSKVASA